MIRMTVALSAAVYLTLLIAGQPDGAVRAGLMEAKAAPAMQTYRYIPVPEATAAVMQVTSPAAAAAPMPAAEERLPTAFVTATALNLRAGPSTSDAALDRLREGEEVSVLQTEGGWTQVRLEGGGGEGWVATRYLSGAALRMASN
ncbi:SH3 domain-containing protein [Falsirhodobacter algicola]|uniref:SH3 domain-containing protein n=1 Tax=Falsirhodobacter algicola TaxID=2692330 RepID=A0A8J8SLL3_9RHOB|nr:SH3 domain-containing protein [Falsirhodobacter algicola]QUS36539.1 SH3 domain-containing protein [Falsirhodobacter algicola]